jgi:hypothetical protein
VSRVATRARPAALVLVVWLFALLVAACGPSGTPATTTGGPPASPVDGVVLTIDSSGLSEVHGFTLRTASGVVLTFSLGTLENPTQFPPGHLAEHQANALPVRAYFVPGSAGQLVVYRLEDAPRPSPRAS